MLEHPYPVTYAIERPERYNRWTVAFRLILILPQALLVGGVGAFSHNGALTTALGVLVFFAWWVILFTGRFPAGMQRFCLLLFRWQQNVHAYAMLQAAPYPPFGEGDYPLRLTVEPAAEHNRWTVAFRLVLAIPHLVVLLFLALAQAVVTLIAWFAILFTGQYPAGLFTFSVGASRWATRVLAYLYLFVDDYPPFSLGTEPAAGGLRAQPA